MAILSLKFLGFVLITLAVYYLLSALRAAAFLAEPVPADRFVLLLRHLVPMVSIPALRVDSHQLWPGSLALQKHTRQTCHFMDWASFSISALMLWFLIGGKYLQNTLEITSANALDIMPLLILPVGMSYYTLNSISYLIDINLRLAKPTTNFVDFALYLAWFPKLISGPLERARKFLPQLAEKQIVDNEVIANSLTLILVGLFRTAILGGMLTLFLPAVPMSNPAAYGNPVLLWALVTYMFYLYNQFAGYTDIVRGVSGLFGIQLSRNFNAPFFSKDVSDFWQRWHISLSQWLRDYIYMPISRAFLRRNPSRTNIPNLIVPPLVTMLISGLWHGADLNHLALGRVDGILHPDRERPHVVPSRAGRGIRFRSGAGSVPRSGWLALMSMATVPFVLDLKQTQIFFVQLIKGWDGADVRPAPAGYHRPVPAGGLVPASKRG